MQGYYRILILWICLVMYKQGLTQPAGNYAYLKNCFSYSTVDSFEIEVDKLGELMSYNFSGDSTIDALFTYYRVPEDKLDKGIEKIAGLAAQRQKDTWKNNSKQVYYKKTETATAIIIDYRLHILIEDIYMQVIVVSEKGWVYELDIFQDKNETKYFDGLAQKIKKKECL